MIEPLDFAKSEEQWGGLKVLGEKERVIGLKRRFELLYRHMSLVNRSGN